MDRLRLLETFVAVVDAGSLSAAARRLKCSLAAVSRQLGALEEELGARLVDRTTRTLRMSTAGERLYPHAVAVLRSMEDARLSVAPGGLDATVRLSVPVGLGLRVVVPAMAALIARHPRLEVELLLEDRPVAAVGEGLDVLVRAGISPIADSSELIVRPLARFPLLLCASPELLAARGTPLHPRELPSLPMVGHLGFRAARRLPLTRGEERFEVQLEARLWSNDILALLRAACAGVGVAALPEWAAADELSRGSLRIVLPDWSLPGGGAWVVYRRKGRSKAAVRAVVEHLQAAFAADAASFGGRALRPAGDVPSPGERRSGEMVTLRDKG